ncbi:TIGR03546 family protein [Planctomycetota bacterium]
MLFRFVRPLRLLARAFTAAGSPRQLALGLALGMLIGLVPKGNLTAGILMVVLLGTQVNLGVGTLSAVLFTWVGGLADPLTHRIGEALLTHRSLEPTWACLHDLPMVPWTGLNNTVVLGSLLLGLWLFYPAYRLSEFVFEHYQPWAIEKLGNYRIVQLLWGAEMAAGWRAR